MSIFADDQSHMHKEMQAVDSRFFIFLTAQTCLLDSLRWRSMIDLDKWQVCI